MERRAILVVVAGLFGGALAACSDPPPGRTYFEREIQPILVQKCSGNTSGCHDARDDDPFQFAAGNLDVTTFENIQKRRDVLAPFGAYPKPLLLIKAVGAKQLKMQYGDAFLDIDVQHAGGKLLDVGSDAYFTLQTWLENGATENGLKPATPAQAGTGACSEVVPPGFDPTPFTAAANQPKLDAFKSTVEPILERKGCNAGSCHGAPQSDFYITCGTSDEQLAFNFSQAWAFVNVPVDDSQLLRVPLAVSSGGRGHTGGDQFPSNEDDDFKAVRAWAESVGKLDFAGADPGKQFFEDHVQPLLLARGCGFQACHSPQAFNDFKLRSGSIGFFSPVALQKNYDLMKHDFMAMEFPDARRSRAVAKTVLETYLDDPNTGEPNPTVAGIAHRGGPVLETQGTTSDVPCPATYDPATATAFCTIQEWVRLERSLDPGDYTDMTAGQPAQVVYVERSGAATAGRLEFDTFQGGADLKLVTTTYGAGGALQPVDGGAGTSLLGNCPGLTAGTADVQAPDVANDGDRVAFAARNSASEPLGVFVVQISTGQCVRITPAAGMSNGLAVHNFDPAWSPDGQWIAFASTRGGASGATRSRKRFLPQSDLWRMKVAGLTADEGSLEQMTVLSNSEISPQFIREGRVVMTTEKVSDGFYQLSGRRMNWDLTDYHPLLAQRASSPFADLTDLTSTAPSVGYESATDLHENSDGNYLIILSNVADDGAPENKGAAGALAVFNRSVGTFDEERVGTEGFLASMKVLDATEVYRGPAPLPDGRILVSRASSPTSGQFEIVMFNPRLPAGQTVNGVANPQVLITGGGNRVDAQLVFKYPARALYYNRRQLVFGGSSTSAGDAIVHMPDAPMLFTLLTANLRRGRPVDAFRSARYLVVYTEGMCPAGPCSPNTNGIYQHREMIGKIPLEDDGSVLVDLPSRTGLIFELQDGDGGVVQTMREEHQLGPGEHISMGVREELFDAVCGGCHNSVSGSELDVQVTPDVLTGASKSAAILNPPRTP